jgi:hypothetical protein
MPFAAAMPGAQQAAMAVKNSCESEQNYHVKT